MSSLNAKAKAPVVNHAGGPSRRFTPYQELRRAVLSCMLWEDTFYESGESIAQRIQGLCDKVTKDELSSLAVEAREVFKLRHVPLLLLCGLVKRGGEGVADVVARVIQRPDEMAELMAIYKSLGNEKMAKQLQKGLAKAFLKFSEYQLAKYNRDGQWKLRDVLFMSHAKPANEDQKRVWESLINGTLPPPDTWEVELSAGKDKKEAFSRLLKEKKLGYLALLRNLRNMEHAGVDRGLVAEALANGDTSRILPFRFVAAARHAPSFEATLDKRMIELCKKDNVFDGKTIVLVDVSGSMVRPLSNRSDMSRMDAACALASLIAGDVRVFSFSSRVVEVPHRMGMAGVDAIRRSQPYIDTYLGAAIEHINTIPHDRLIVITDEQAQGRVPQPVATFPYLINVAPYRTGIEYGRWIGISGFSEGVIRYMKEFESFVNKI